MWTDTDVLYAMFILKANCLICDTVVSRYQSDEQLWQTVALSYSDLFADRAIAEEEFEGEMYAVRFADADHDYVSIKIPNTVRGYGRLKFRFVEE